MTALRQLAYWALRFQEAVDAALLAEHRRRGVDKAFGWGGTRWRAMMQVLRSGTSKERQAFVSTVLDEMSRPVSYTATLSGNSMAPTLNAHIDSPFRAGERLVVRRLWSVPGATAVSQTAPWRWWSQWMPNRGSHLIAHRGDIVVVVDPEDGQRKFVRRVVAVQGDELVCEDVSEQRQVLRLERDEYWVMRDNDADMDEEVARLRQVAAAERVDTEPAASATSDNAGANAAADKLPLEAQVNLLRILRRDSRNFGPVTADHIVGRVVYAIRNEADHGRVQNSGESMQRDSVILAVELQQLLGMC
ncbi:hypothetical protein CDCA_CDCA10G3007 [Cyanidium caldarium]|uniref:Peptidase S26 domain-containing protein n=1 Tax=Cyanidium caldarium TaxID=2771 RepID=A0AAV9IXG8_CYACA|nr:hypothetical protein CDCA_CDCA10G3007 [Cyanidium caldarium]